MDADVTDQLGFKFLVSKLSGFAKFDLDTKIAKVQFFHMIEEGSKVAGVDEEGNDCEPEFNQEIYDTISNAWNMALTQATAPFTGDLENPTYLKIIQCMRDFKPEMFPAASESKLE